MNLEKCFKIENYSWKKFYQSIDDYKKIFTLWHVKDAKIFVQDCCIEQCVQFSIKDNFIFYVFHFMDNLYITQSEYYCGQLIANTLIERLND